MKCNKSLIKSIKNVPFCFLPYMGYYFWKYFLHSQNPIKKKNSYRQIILAHPHAIVLGPISKETKTNNSTPFERNQFIGGNEKKSKTEKKRQKQNLLASW